MPATTETRTPGRQAALEDVQALDCDLERGVLAMRGSGGARHRQE